MCGPCEELYDRMRSEIRKKEKITSPSRKTTTQTLVQDGIRELLKETKLCPISENLRYTIAVS